MEYHWLKRVSGGILAGVMVLHCFPMPTFAAETDGLCPHHTQHTEACGYSAAVEWHECGHEHTDECYQSVTECVHVHGDCGYVPAVEGQDCECQPDENGEIVHTDGCGFVEAVAEGPCGHVCSEESGCITKVLTCQHQHDSECGYVEGKEESPCTFMCEECAKEAADKEAADGVAALIQALPTVDALQEMTTEQQAEAYKQVQDAYDTYNALTEEQTVLLSDPEGIFAPLFDYFNAQTAPAVGSVASGTCGKNLTWVLDDEGTLTISGTGEMWDFEEYAEIPWRDFCTEISSVEVESGVTSIGDRAFSDFYVLRSMELPDTLRTIGTHAFESCTDLETITIPEGVERISAYAIWCCENLQSIIIPASTRNIEEGNFKSCIRLQSITVTSGNDAYSSNDGVLFNAEGTELLKYPEGKQDVTYSVPDGVTRIPSWAFEDCQYLKDVELPNTLQRISSYSFFNCGEMIGITLSAGVVNVGTYAFSSTPLKWIRVDSGNTAFSSIDGVLFNKDATKLIIYPEGKNTERYILPDSVAWVGPCAFERNDSLKNVVLPSSLTTIDACAFSFCGSLTEIKIPKNVNVIGPGAFQKCVSLEAVYFTGNAPNIYRNPFAGVTAKCYYPDTNATWIEDVLQDYGGDLTWLPYELPLEDLDRSGQLGENLTWELTEDGTLTISGLGEMPYYWGHDQYPWGRLRPEIQKVVVGLGVETVGNYAFAKCKNLTEVSLPNTLRQIQNYAFYSCPELTEITIPKKVYHLYSAAFKSCDKLHAIHMQQQSSNCRIEEDAFSGVTADVFFYGNAWQQSDRKDYGGHLKWIDLREKVQSIELHSSSTQAAGTMQMYNVSCFPANAVYELEYRIADTEIAEIANYFESGCYVNALKVGKTVLTVSDKGTGISASIPIEVTKPSVIPSGTTFSDTFQVITTEEQSYSFSRTYTFVPSESGEYQLEITHVNAILPGDVGLGSIEVFCAGGAVEGRYTENRTKTSVIFLLDVGSEYTIRLGYTGSDKPQNTTFTLKKYERSADSEQELLKIYPVDTVLLFSGGSSHGYVNYHYTGDQPLQWSTDHPELLQIDDVNQYFLSFTPLQAGTANIYCTGSGISRSVPVRIQAAVPLRLNEYVYMSLKESDRKGFEFTAPEDGVYYFGAKEATESKEFYWNIHSSYGRMHIANSYTGDGKVTYCTLQKGDVLHISANAVSFTGTFYVKKATSTSSALKLTLLNSYGDSFELGCSYFPVSGQYSPILDWISSDERICYPNSYFYEGTCNFTVLKEGDVTITAITADGQRATIDLHVGRCLKSHDFGEWKESTAAIFGEGPVHERKCKHCDTKEVFVIVSEERNLLDVAEMGLKAGQTLWIDGVPYDVDASEKIDLEGVNANTAVLYSYHADGSDVHTQYPTGMKVWKLKHTDEGYTAEYVPEFDNLLQYSGSSIRITGNKGIRMITSVNQDTRNALTGTGLAGFKLLEYGTLLAQTSKLGNNPLVLGGGEYVKSNYAYKKGVADPVFKYTNGLIQYTNVLIGFTDEQCKEDIAMRPYMKLLDENGEEVVIYGGIVYRSIGYIAYQNRNAFQPRSAAYEYVWSIIHNVYGNRYDSEYKK